MRRKALDRLIISPVLQTWWRFSRGMTLGVRGVATDEAGRVMLVRHGYVSGWHLPGGGVERGQTAVQAMEAEFIEEAGIELTSPPVLLGVFNNSQFFPNDHVLLFQAAQWRACTPRASSREIAERGFFALDALPDGTTRATRARLNEVFAGAPADAHW